MMEINFMLLLVNPWKHFTNLFVLMIDDVHRPKLDRPSILARDSFEWDEDRSMDGS